MLTQKRAHGSGPAALFARLFETVSVRLQYLGCLSSSQSSADKLAFDVGLQEDKEGITSLLFWWWLGYISGRRNTFK